MPARALAGKRDEVGSAVAEAAAGAVQLARGVGVGEPVEPLGVARLQVQTLVAGQQEQTHQQQAQGTQPGQQSLLEIEEGGGEATVLAKVQNVIEQSVRLKAEVVGGVCWTVGRGVV